MRKKRQKEVPMGFNVLMQISMFHGEEVGSVVISRGDFGRVYVTVGFQAPGGKYKEVRATVEQNNRGVYLLEGDEEIVWDST